MTPRAFVDTNVLVYALDDGEPVKRDQARELLGDAGSSLVISAQVIGEFYVVIRRKLSKSLSEDEAAARVDELLRMPVVAIDGELTRAAVATSRSACISYWDALIVEAAASARCELLLTEDLSDGAEIGSVRIRNPFA